MLEKIKMLQAMSRTDLVKYVEGLAIGELRELFNHLTKDKKLPWADTIINYFFPKPTPKILETKIAEVSKPVEKPVVEKLAEKVIEKPVEVSKPLEK